MLLPDFEVKQIDCNSLIFRDITPAYSTEYIGGYGSMNVDADRIMKAEIGIELGKNGYYFLTKDYNQTKGEWRIDASDIFYKPGPNGCTDCANPCGCEDCNDGEKVSVDCHGYLSSFPEGCIKIKYEVFSVDSQTNQFKSEGTKVKTTINFCHQQKKLIDLADKYSGGQNELYDFNMPVEKRFKIQSKIVLAWSKLELLKFDQNCDCGCIESRLKRVRVDLNSIS